MSRPLTTILALALGSLACGCSPSPRPNTLPPTSTAAEPAAPPVSPNASASKLRCHVSRDCQAGEACVYEAGCDKLEGRCAPRQPVECRASTPIATCDGVPHAGCRNAQVEVPFYGLAEDTDLVDMSNLLGRVASVVVHRAPENLQADTGMTSERLETGHYDHLGSRDPEVVRTAIDIFRIALPRRGGTLADLRYELVLLAQDGSRIGSIGFDGLGDKGLVDTTRVTFAHRGGLAAIRALAAKIGKSSTTP